MDEEKKHPTPLDLITEMMAQGAISNAWVMEELLKATAPSGLSMYPTKNPCGEVPLSVANETKLQEIYGFFQQEFRQKLRKGYKWNGAWSCILQWEVEVGDKILDVITDMQAFADESELPVRCTFNMIQMTAYPNGLCEEVAKEWEAGFRSTHGFAEKAGPQTAMIIDKRSEFRSLTFDEMAAKLADTKKEYHGSWVVGQVQKRRGSGKSVDYSAYKQELFAQAEMDHPWYAHSSKKDK
jgi:hypothetical protein